MTSDLNLRESTGVVMSQDSASIADGLARHCYDHDLGHSPSCWQEQQITDNDCTQNGLEQFSTMSCSKDDGTGSAVVCINGNCSMPDCVTVTSCGSQPDAEAMVPLPDTTVAKTVAVLGTGDVLMSDNAELYSLNATPQNACSSEGGNSMTTGTGALTGGSEESKNDRPATNSRSGRTLRRCRQDSETVICCPVCKLTLRPADVSSHIQVEIDRLSKVSGRQKRPSAGDSNASPRKKAYLRVQRNRQARQRARERCNDTLVDYTTCPVCNEMINGTPEELNEHVEYCLNRVQKTSEDQDVDIDHSDEEFEEYEWAGQTRVRASSMLLRDGPVASTSSNSVDEAIDLNIEDDDRDVYGQAQYTEADLYLCASEEPDDDVNRDILRNALLGGERSSARLSSSDGKWNCSYLDTSNSSSPSMPTSSGYQSSSLGTKSESSTTSSTSPDAIIRCLKAKISEQEQQLHQAEIPRCLICMEPYTKPVTSIQCWHVHCEECWLRTLGAKKLCPQCNMITTPSDLRRIYL